MLVGVGGMFLGYATWRYFQVQAALLKGAFPVNRVGVRVRDTALIVHFIGLWYGYCAAVEADGDIYCCLLVCYL
jgi:hypothetical protein